MPFVIMRNDTVNDTICRARLPKKLLTVLQRFDEACNPG